MNLYKLTNESGVHHGYTFTEGYHRDPNPWSTEPCSKGGFYVTSLEHLASFLGYDSEIGPMVFVYDVKIDENEPFQSEDNKFKAHAITLSNKRHIETLMLEAAMGEAPMGKTPDFYLKAVQMHPYALHFIENPSLEIQIAAMKYNGFAIRHIKDPSEEVQLEAIKRHKSSFCFIDKPTKRVKNLYRQLAKKSGKSQK